MRDDWCNISTEDFSHRQAAKLKIRLSESSLNFHLLKKVKLSLFKFLYKYIMIYEEKKWKIKNI